MSNITKTLIFTIILITILPMIVFASTLKLQLKTDKSRYEIGDNVVATVDWTEKMQAASFKIKYDSDILEFKSASIANTYYNTDTNGEISINWASMEDKDLTKMTFEFKVLKTGSANISIKNVEAFADGNMKSPDDYNITSDGSVDISINAKNSSQDNKNQENTVKEEKNTEDTKKAYSTKEEGTKISSKLPNTGLRTVIIPAIIISIFGILGYIKYRRLSGI